MARPTSLDPDGGCPVCRCGDIERDEVAHEGTLLLAECTRCAHRWTQRQPHSTTRLRALSPLRERATLADATRALPEVASAA